MNYIYLYLKELITRTLRMLKQDGIEKTLKCSYRFLVQRRGRLILGKINAFNYRLWIRKNEKWNREKIKKEIKNFKCKPKISIITPVYNVDSKWLDKCIESVKNQFYENWELCLHDDASTKRETVKCLKKWGKQDKRIKISYGKNNQHISGASNNALRLATGEFIALLDNDDEFSPDALFESVKLINKHPKADFIYSDEDKLKINGIRVEPFFKPDWSPDLFLSMNYTCHLGIYRKSIVDKIGGFRKGYEGAQDYDLILRFIEHTHEENIFHISKVLYHWRKIVGSTAEKFDFKNYANDAGKKSLEDYINRNNIKGIVLNGFFPGSYRIKRYIKEKAKVSIIIPFKDQVNYLKKCLDSIISKTTYKNYEIILVNNESKKKETTNYLKKIKTNPNIIILKYEKAFNFSAINNFAAKKASGAYLLFLNNDTAIISDDWIESLLEHAQRSDVGAVGAKLIYPNDTIQHAGVIMGLGVASHGFKGFPVKSNGYFGLINVIRNYCAVTAACLLIKKITFEKCGGFNEKDTSIAYNDVDLCLKLKKMGFRSVYTPFAELYHYESLSRGNDNRLKYTNLKKYKRVLVERNYMLKKWKKYIDNDPYYNPNLTRESNDFRLRDDKK